MTTLDLVERHQGVRLICHAIRHLLDHSPDAMNPGDTEAIDILQFAINPAQDSHPLSYAAEGQYPNSCAFRNSTATAAMVHPGEHPAPERTSVGEVVAGCRPPESARRSLSLLSLLELLLRAAHRKVLGHRALPLGTTEQWRALGK